MKTILLLMLFQMLLGFWMFVSPFAFGVDTSTGAAVGNMVLGAVLAAVGLWILLRETSPACREEICT